MGEVNNKLLVGIDVSKYKEKIRNDDKFLPYVNNYIGYEMQIIDDSENDRFLYFGKVLAYGWVKAETNIVDFESIAKQVVFEYKNLFDEEISLNDVKIISCSLVW